MNNKFRRYRLLPLLLLCLASRVWGGESLEVAIHGLTGELLDNVRASLRIEQRKNRPGLTENSIRKLHAKAENQIQRALEPFGHYRPRIESSLQAPAAKGAPWRARYQIEPGPLLPIAEIEIRFAGAGADDPGLERLSTSLRLRQDTHLDHRHYESAKRDLLQKVRDHGYLDAELTTHQIRVDLDRYQARIELVVNTGPRFVFGPIEMDQDLFDPDYLEHYLIIEPGQDYSSAELARQRRTFGKSGHFRNVDIQPLPATDSDPPEIPLRAEFEPFKPNRYRASIGWGTDTGIGVQGDWNRRYIGRRGHRFNLGSGLVQERKQFSANLSYFIPLDPLAGSKIELTARHDSKDLTFKEVELDEGGESRIATNQVSAFWRLPREQWRDFESDLAFGGSLVTESYDVFKVLFGHLPLDEQEIISDFIGPEDMATLSPSFTSLVPELRWTIRRSDDRLFIRDGDYLNLELRGAHKALGSNISFWQASLETWHIRPLFQSGRLLLRGDFGYSQAKSREVLGANFNLMPEYFEFRAGGARNLRGYAYESLFPNTAITGAKHILVGSAEYEQEIIPDWSVAVFLDAGNAFNQFNDIKPKFGTGLGARWRSPVGLARADLGIPLNKAEDAFQIHITIGPEF